MSRFTAVVLAAALASANLTATLAFAPQCGVVSKPVAFTRSILRATAKDEKASEESVFVPSEETPEGSEDVEFEKMEMMSSKVRYPVPIRCGIDALFAFLTCFTFHAVSVSEKTRQEKEGWR